MTSEAADGVEASESRARVGQSEMALAIYAAITLMGVIAAASWKGMFANDQELLVIIGGTSVTIAVAHLWAAVAAHRVARRRPFNSAERSHELRNSAAILMVGVLAIAVLAITWRLGADLETSIRFVLGMMIAVLFAVGVIGARREKRSWPVSIGWGLIDSSIGLVLLLLKIFVSG